MTPTTRPDVGQLGREDLRREAFPGRGPTPFRVVMLPAVHAEIAAHCAGQATVEVGGVLVGRWGRDEDGPFAVVTASIRGEGMTSRTAEVTFTHETWAAINRRMDSDFVNEAIVGWYHSHPNFGVFLSDRDLFIHEHFFAAPGQIAYVVDPVRREEGVFAWRDGRPDRLPLHWVGGEPRGLAPVATPVTTDTVAAADRGAAPTPGPAVRASLRSSPLLLTFAAVGLVLLGYGVGRLSNRLRDAQLAEAIARQLAQRSTSLESTAAIARAASRLGTVASILVPAAPATTKEGDPPVAPADLAQPAARDAILGELDMIHRDLLHAMRMLDLSPVEEEAINLLLARRIREIEAAARLRQETPAANPGAGGAERPAGDAGGAKEGARP